MINKILSNQKGQAKFWIVILIVVIVVIALILALSGEKPAKVAEKTALKGPIKLGFMAPLSGDTASYGLSIKKGVDLAKKEMGLENVKIVYEDSRCEGKEAVTAINKLISIDKVVAIVGEVCSGATLAAAPIASQNGVVMVSSASTSPRISDEEYVFRTVPSDALQGDFGAELIYQRGHKKLAVLYSNEEYGLGFNNVLKEVFPKLSGEVVASETFERGSTDVRTQLTKIKAASPNAIYIISNSPDSAVAALKQIKELGLEVAVFASEGLKSDDILKGAGGSAEGMIVTSVSSGTTEFAKSHEAEYGEAPGPFAAQAYDALKSIALAVQAGAKTGPEIKDKFKTLEFDGASGKIKFDARGDIAGNYDVYVAKNGAFVLSK